MTYIFSHIKSNEVYRRNKLEKPVTSEFLLNLYDTGKFDLDELMESARQQFEDIYSKRYGKQVHVSVIPNYSRVLLSNLKEYKSELVAHKTHWSIIHTELLAGTGVFKVNSTRVKLLVELLGEDFVCSMFFSRLDELVRDEVDFTVHKIPVQKIFSQIPLWDIDYKTLSVFQEGQKMITGAQLGRWYRKFKGDNPTEWIEAYIEYLERYFELIGDRGEFIFYPTLKADCLKAFKRVFGGTAQAREHFGLTNTVLYWWWSSPSEEIDEFAQWQMEYYGLSEATIIGTRNVNFFIKKFKDTATQERISKEFIEDFDDTVQYLKIEYR
jgi:hypothetical protein